MYRIFGMNIAEKEYIESEYKKYKSNFAFSVENPAIHKDDTIYTLFTNSAEFVNDIQLDDVILDHNKKETGFKPVSLFYFSTTSFNFLLSYPADTLDFVYFIAVL